MIRIVQCPFNHSLSPKQNGRSGCTVEGMRVHIGYGAKFEAVDVATTDLSDHLAHVWTRGIAFLKISRRNVSRSISSITAFSPVGFLHVYQKRSSLFKRVCCVIWRGGSLLKIHLVRSFSLIYVYY